MDLNLSVSLWLPHWRLPNRFIGFFCFNQETTGYWLSRFPARHDIDLYQQSWDNIDEFVSQLNNTIRALLDRHAPVKKKHIYGGPCAPWMTGEIRYAKRSNSRVEICTESNFSGHLTTMD